MKKLLLTTLLATAVSMANAQSVAKPNEAIQTPNVTIQSAPATPTVARPNEAIQTPNAPIQNATVSIYGIIDAGFISTNYRGIGVNPNINQQTSSFGNSAETASRLGVKGTEDLGGGRSAFYTFETALNVTQSTLTTWNNRQSFVGIKQNGLGAVSVGTIYTPLHQMNAQTDPGQLNDMPGNVIFANNPQSNFNATGNAPFASASSSGGSGGSYTSRTSNTVNVTSDNFKGFKGMAMYTRNDSSQTTTNTVTNKVVTTTAGGTNNHSGYGLAASYTWNKLFVTAAYQALKSQNTVLVTTPAPALWSAADGGTNINDAQRFAAATYDFGILKGYAQWVSRKAESGLNPNLYSTRTAQQLGVRGNFTPNIESWASIGNGNVKTFGAGAPTANFTAFQLGSNYWLSKRTNLYAIYGQNKTASTSGTLGLPSVSASGYALGVRTVF